jgi:formyltetrahydrofolate deformylase
MTAADATPREDAPEPSRMRLLISCPDRPGIVSAVSGFLTSAGANIVRSDQHTTDPRGGTFFMRMEFDISLDPGEQAEIERRFVEEIAGELEMHWQLSAAGTPKRIAILASRADHCLLDLLWRQRRGELEATFTLVASNHPDLRADVDAFGLRYEHVPIDPNDKAAGEARLLELLSGQADVVVLARYMQILSGDFLSRLAVPVINIHHSFLPSFAGADPYKQASERGVKLIGATAHYVTEQLDAGPIIEQDVLRVSHRADAQELRRLGAGIERSVLTHAVQRHCEDRVLIHGNTTIVF